MIKWKQKAKFGKNIKMTISPASKKAKKKSYLIEKSVCKKPVCKKPVCKRPVCKRSDCIFFKKPIFLILLAIAVLFFISGRFNNTSFSIKGVTMGTTYSISGWGESNFAQTQIKIGVEGELAKIQNIASTWIATSEISKFNQSATTDWVDASDFLIKNIVIAKYLNLITGGAFDIKLASLIDAWGFDSKAKNLNDKDAIIPPTKTELKQLLDNLTGGEVTLNLANRQLRKNKQNVKINLSAIAKGGAVDALSDYLNSISINNFIIEIGGEIRTQGFKQDGSSWLVGIEKPQSANRAISTILKMDNLSLATSGNYRNFFKKDGKLYSHIINPKTGSGSINKIVSTSVIISASSISQFDILTTKDNKTAQTFIDSLESGDGGGIDRLRSIFIKYPTALADRFATALMVLSVDEGIKLTNRLKIPAMIIVMGKKDFTIIKNDYWQDLK